MIFSKKIFLFIFCFFLISFANAQDLTEPIQSPRKAAILSSTLPGLGQIYNKKYWKIPIVYAGMGAGIYFYIKNNKQYNRYRDAYKSRLAGLTTDEFSDADGNPLLSDESLIDAQNFYSRNKEVSLLVTAAFYLLNIIDFGKNGNELNIYRLGRLK